MTIRPSAASGDASSGINREITLVAPAKINLFFEVLARRPDGFHEIETLMVPIGLYDTLRATDEPAGDIALHAAWDEALEPHAAALGDLPTGEANIVVKAVRLLAQRANVTRGARLILTKRIPSAAGLGGGSSDAAAALVAANRLWKLGWTTGQLAAVAAELGSDVPFFLSSAVAICRGRGERIEPVAGIGPLHLVLVRPPEGLATAAVYRACSPGNPPRLVEPVVKALQQGDLAALGPVAHNRLLEPARALSPWVGKVLDVLAAESCPAIGMSGSGTSCFAICHNALQAQTVAGRMRAQQLGMVWALTTI